MNFSKNLHDDLKLTAYALGELEGDERAAVEAALRRDPAARAAVEEIRATAAKLEAALGAEARGEVTAPALISDESQPLAEPEAPASANWNSTQLHGGTQWRAPRPVTPTLLRFPQFYYLVGGLAAACFAVLVLTRDKKPSAAPVVLKTYREVRLQPDSVKSTDAVATDELKIDADEPNAAPTKDGGSPGAATVAGATPAVGDSGTFAGPNAGATKGRIFDRDLSLLAQAEEKKGAATTGDAASVGPSAGLETIAKAEPYTIGESRGETLGATIANSISIGTNRTVGVVPAPGQVGVAPRQSVQAIPRPSSDGNFAGSAIESSSPADNEMVDLAAFSAASHPSFGQRFFGIFKGASQSKNSTEQRIALLAENQRAAAAAQMPDAVPVPRVPIPTSKSQPAKRTFAAGERLATPTPALSLRGDYGAIESYAFRREGDFLAAAQYRLSTFPIAVETASYANVRRFIDSGRLPPIDAVRVEELINYFPYAYAGSSAAFTAALEVAEAPWAPGHRLVRIGLKGREVSADARPPANLVFLLDVSGSMNVPGKLPLMKESMRMLVGKLRPDDRVAIVAYGSTSQLALAPTPVSDSARILEALDALTTSGSTNGADGIELAYDIAKINFKPEGINRVILCTDGDFNVGATSEGDLVRLIEAKAKSGVLLTVLGFGMGNYKDAILERFADAGNGNYGYIDTRGEAEKMLVDQLNGTLVTIAKDVKLQVEFNPLRVAKYRLIGYEDRMLKPEDFSNDNVGAGEVGAGHTITALYEIVPVGAEEKTSPPAAAVDELRYQLPGEARPAPPSSALRDPKYAELLTVKVRYKEPSGDVSRKLEFPLADSAEKFTAASADFKFAAAVAEFGMILRQSPHKGSGTMADVLAWAADGARGVHGDPGGYRGEFLDLARRTQLLLR